MLEKNSVVAMFEKHTQAEEAVKELQKAGFNMKAISIVGKGYHVEEDVVGFYSTGDRMMSWGKSGAFWGGIWGMLFGSGVFLIPGVGPMVVAGPLVAWIAGALETAFVVGGISAIGAGLYSLDIPKKSILQYDTSLKAGMFMLVYHGTAEAVTRAKSLLINFGASDTQVHLCEKESATLA